MSVVTFQDLPLTDRKRRWSADTAERRVRRWAGAEDAPSAKYRKAFVWFDGGAKDNFTSYKLQIADVIDGELKAVPRAVFAAAAAMQGSRGGMQLPQADIRRVRNHLGRYYAKLGEDPPWSR